MDKPTEPKRGYRKRYEWASTAYAFRLSTHPDEKDEKERLDEWLAIRNGDRQSSAARLAEIVLALIREYSGEKPPSITLEGLINRRLDRLEKMIRDGQKDLLEAIVANPQVAQQVYTASVGGQALDDDFINNLMSDFDRE